MDKYIFLLEIGEEKIEFTCEDDSKEFMGFLNYAYKEFNLDKNAEIKVIEKEKVR